MGFYLDQNKELINQLIEMNRDAAGVDLSENLSNLKRLRRAYLELHQQAHTLATRVYHQQKEIRNKKWGIETENDNDI